MQWHICSSKEGKQWKGKQKRESRKDTVSDHVWTQMSGITNDINNTCIGYFTEKKTSKTEW